MKYRIEVRNGDGSVVEVIRRKVWYEPLGNFAPVFCRYDNKQYLVQSDKPDLDDPLKCNLADHIGKLFIHKSRPRGIYCHD